MIGTTNITRRLTTGLAFAAVVAAVAAPAGLAGSTRSVGPLDPWAVKYVSPAGAVGLPDAWAVKYLTPGGSNGQPDAWAVKYLTPTHFPATFQVPSSERRPGFDWGSFGIGIGAGIGALLVLGAVAARLGKLRPLASA